MKTKLILLTYLLLNTSLLFAQKVDTIQLDESKIRTIQLPEELLEISTLEFDDRSTKELPLFWALNDSQNKNEIYLFDGDTGKIVQTLVLDGVINYDWEEITQDEQYIYVGEFGNNLGSRQDLAVYAIDKKQIDPSKEIQYVNFKTISFYYPEQTSYEIKNRKNDHDLEAFFAYNGKLHLFSKEWASRKTTHYTIDPNLTNKQAAKKIETFDTQFLVTAAYLSNYKESKGLYLLGYTQEGIAFLNWFKLTDNSEKFFNTDKIKNIPLGFTAELSQLEGISINPLRNEVCISGEKIDYKGIYVEQKLHCFPTTLVNK